MFTDKDISEIEIMKNKNINELKTLLANETTSMLHGKAAAKKAAETAEKTFGAGSFGADLPIIKIKKNQVNSGINIIDIVVMSNLLKSKSEARRAIKNFGIKVNNNTINSDNINITIDNFKDNILKLSHGKKNHVLFKITN